MTNYSYANHLLSLVEERKRFKQRFKEHLKYIHGISVEASYNGEEKIPDECQNSHANAESMPAVKPSARQPAAADPEPVTPSAVATDTDSASASPAALPEPVADRDARRLREFKELGGAVQISREGRATLTGRQGAIQELADRERAAGRPRSDRSDIGKALRAEAERQHKALLG